jgi:hypothetical protein
MSYEPARQREIAEALIAIEGVGFRPHDPVSVLAGAVDEGDSRL